MNQFVFQVVTGVTLGLIYKYFGVYGLIGGVGSILGGIIYNTK